MEVHSPGDPFPGSTSTPDNAVELPVRLEVPTRRARSSSKVFGKANPLTVRQRQQFAHILVLLSLNDTFDKKTLSIPQYPEVLKLGRPNNAQKAPNMYNGYFDSRVISREHAELYTRDGTIYLRDCRSANGTFVNGAKITEEHALQKTDTVDLGIDIDNESNKNQLHRKISCIVDGLLTIPIDVSTDLSEVLADLARKPEKSIQDELSPFDAAVFGDVAKELEDVALGADHDFLSGIFVNNNVGTSSSLTQSVRLLITQLHQEKMNNLKLASIQKFLEQYENQVGSREKKEDSLLQKKLARCKELVDAHVSTIQEQTAKITEQEHTIDELSSRNPQEQLLSKVEQLQELAEFTSLEIEQMRKESELIGAAHAEETVALKETIKRQKKQLDELQKREKLHKHEACVARDMYRMGITVSVVVVGASLVLRLW